MEVSKYNTLTSFSFSRKVSRIALLWNIFRHSISKSTFVMCAKPNIGDEPSNVIM